MTSEQKNDQHRRMVRENLYRPLKYARKEFESAIEVIRVRNVAAQGYFANLKLVSDEKDKIISLNDPSKWDLDPALKETGVTIESLLKEKENPQKRELIKYLMLHSKRFVTDEMRKTVGYFNQLFKGEILEFGRSLKLKLASSQGTLAAEMIESMGSQKNLWDKMLQKASELVVEEC